jgi:cyclomaltodextrin glucanotransferase
VYQKGGLNQTALVLLNKGDGTATFEVSKGLSTGHWRDANSGEVFTINAESPGIVADVPAHDVRVMLLDAPIDNAVFAGEMSRLQRGSARR